MPNHRPDKDLLALTVKAADTVNTPDYFKYQ